MASGGHPTTPRGHLFDEVQWLIQICHALEKEIDEDDDSGIPVTIFNVPKSLQLTKPEDYIPQLLALGPYHRWRPELYEMERYKLDAAKRAEKKFRSMKLRQLVEKFTKHQRRIRAYYHRFLDFKDETLAWMMAVDASFLLEFLQVFVIQDQQGKVLRRLSSRMLHLVDTTGRKFTHNAILRDMMMLENQIPLFLLRKTMELQYPSSEEADGVLSKMLINFLKELCPLKMMDNFPESIDVAGHAHLLELLYYVLVPKSEEADVDTTIDMEDQNEEPAAPTDQSQSRFETNSDHVKQLFSTMWGFCSNLNQGPIRFVKQVIVSKPISFAVKLPWKVVTSLPGFSVMKQPVEAFFREDNDKKLDVVPPGSSAGANMPTLVEEIMIPSVSELVNVGVRFSPTNGDLMTIAFDVKTVTLCLPTVVLDVNTEVVLRNLVAYEASAATGPLVFTRYTELMNGIIDTEEDVKLLRERGIVVNRMKSDKKVANLWNGMSKSVRLTRVPFLDKVIEDVNRYHSSRWRVKTAKFMNKYVFGSWPFLTFIAAILMLLLTALQAFCSVYTCSRWFGVVNLGKTS